MIYLCPSSFVRAHLTAPPHPLLSPVEHDLLVPVKLRPIWWNMVEYGGIWWNMVEYGGIRLEYGEIWWNTAGIWWNTVEYGWNMVEYSWNRR